MVKKPKEPIERVIPDSRDGSKDYYIPRSKARELFDAGELHRDMTNNAYCPAKDGTTPGKR